MDKNEFEELLMKHQGAVERYVYYKIPSKSVGEDIIQEVFLTALQHYGSLRNQGSFKAWLLRIAANKCNDYFRYKAKHAEIPMDNTTASVLTQSRFGITVQDVVRDTLEELADKDRQIISLYYFSGLTQAEIAHQLDIPLGTVKSRLYTARRNFQRAYPYPPKKKGATSMRTLPRQMPDYRITETSGSPFPVKWEEMMGWFIVPKLGEAITWAMYDFPERMQTRVYELKVTGKASVHNIPGVEIVATEWEPKSPDRQEERTFVVQLTDAHCRILSESHYVGDEKRFYTFLDADDFLPNWGFGEDNCGNEVNIKPKGIISREGKNITCRAIPAALDVVGRYKVEIDGNAYDTILVMDIELYNGGVASETYLDEKGRTILWRRFNRDDWALERYKKKWSEKLPSNERICVNGETYVHWYDCITDYILKR